MVAPTHHEIAPYPKGKFVNGDFYGERLVECADSDLATLIDYFDENDTFPYNFGGWSTSALCTAAEVQPKPGGKVTSSTSPLIDYDRAQVKLIYATKPMYAVGSYRLWEEIRPGVQGESAGRGLLYWSDGTPVQDGSTPISWFRSALKYRISFFKQAAAPALLSTLPACVNATNYTTASLGYTFAAGTLLCVGAQVMRGSPGAVAGSWKQAHWEFWYHPDGWNKMPRLETGAYEAVYRPDGVQWLAQTSATFAYTDLGSVPVFT